MRKLVVLILDGDAPLSVKIVRSLGLRSDVDIHIFSEIEWVEGTPGLYTAHIYHGNSGDDQKKLERIEELVRSIGITVLLPQNESNIEFVIRNRNELEQMVHLPPLPDEKSFNTAEDKWLLYEFGKSLNIPVPHAVSTGTFADNQLLPPEMKYPLLQKQNTGTTGGAGIVRIDSLDEMEQVLESESNDKCPQGCFIQQYIFGQAASMNALCRNGNIIAHTIQIGIGETIAFGSPSLVRLIKNNAIFTTGKKLFKALNWNGVVNIDFVIDQDNNEAWVLEINPRFWGLIVVQYSKWDKLSISSLFDGNGGRFPKTRIPVYGCRAGSGGTRLSGVTRFCIVKQNLDCRIKSLSKHQLHLAVNEAAVITTTDRVILIEQLTVVDSLICAQ